MIFMQGTYRHTKGTLLSTVYHFPDSFDNILLPTDLVQKGCDLHTVLINAIYRFQLSHIVHIILYLNISKTCLLFSGVPMSNMIS